MTKLRTKTKALGSSSTAKTVSTEAKTIEPVESQEVTTSTDEATSEATDKATGEAVSTQTADSVNDAAGKLDQFIEVKPQTKRRGKKQTLASQLKASVRVEDLVQALALCKQFVDPKNDKLKFVKLTASNKALALQAFNGLTQVVTSIEADVEVEGSVLIRPVIEVLPLLAGDVTLELMGKGSIHSEQGLLSIPFGKTDAFPQLTVKECNTYTIDAKQFSEAIACSAIRSDKHDGLQIQLFAPFEESSSGKSITPVRALSTSGEAIVRYGNTTSEGTPIQSFMIPSNMCRQIKCLCDDGSITLKVGLKDVPTIQVSSNGTNGATIASQTLEIKKDFNEVMPSDLSEWNQLKVDLSSLRDCISRHATVYDDADKRVKAAGLPLKLVFKGQGEIQTSSSYQEVAWSQSLEEESGTTEQFELILNLDVLRRVVGLPMMQGSAAIIEVSPDRDRVLISTSSSKTEVLIVAMAAID